MKDESQQQQILDDLPTVKNHCILVEPTNKDLSAEQNLHALTRWIYWDIYIIFWTINNFNKYF